MNDKITLEEIVGYLPYGLKVTYKNGETKDIISKMIGIEDENNILTEKHVVSMNFAFKPILHPLSDLTKEIEVNGEKFVPLRYLHTNVFMCDYPEFELTTDLEILINSPESQFNITLGDINSMFQKLYSWHFDIHNLINRNLAIDINTIKS